MARLNMLLCAAWVAAVMASSQGAAAADSEPEAPSPPPRADEPSASGLRIGLRTGMALPVGDAFVSSGPLTDTIRAYVPLRLDLGYRIARHFYVGADVQLAALVPNNCPSGASCSGHDIRFGALVAYHLLPSEKVDPWIAAGMGFEMLNISRSSGGANVDFSARGLELLDVELGADIRPNASLRLGPVLSSSIGRFARVSVNGASTADFDTALHAWVMLGFRGAFDL
jgi:opacity protein-like surface antigen